MRQDDRDDFEAWLAGEILLIGLLGASLALFVTNRHLQTEVYLPNLRLAHDVEPVLHQQPGERGPGQRMVVDKQDSLGHRH